MRISLTRRIRVGGLSLGLFFAAMFLSGYSAKNPDLVRYGAMAVEQILRPVQSVQQGTWGGISNLWSEYVYLVGLRAENESLKTRLSALEAENSKLIEVEVENKNLKKLINFPQQGRFTTVAASVIAYDPSNWVQRVTINRGTVDGIAEGMAVIQGDAIVGQVIAAAYSSAQVLLITDHVSGVDAMEQVTRARGVVVGAGVDDCEMRFVSREEELKVGDRVVTTGVDGLYPKGLLVGVISEVRKSGTGPVQFVGVRPSVDFTRLEAILVVTKSKPMLDDSDPQIPTSTEKVKK